MRKNYLVCYDIVENRPRNKIAEALKDSGGVRLQKSVFECRLNSAEQEALGEHIDELIDHGTDNVLFFPLCATCLQGRSQVGINVFTEKQDFIIL